MGWFNSEKGWCRTEKEGGQVYERCIIVYAYYIMGVYMVTDSFLSQHNPMSMTPFLSLKSCIASVQHCENLVFYSSYL